MKRKKFLKITSSSLALVLLGGIPAILKSCKKAMNMNMSSGISVIIGKFDYLLKFPEVINYSQPIKLIAKRNISSIIKDKIYKVLGYGNGILGPVIKVDNGQSVTIDFENKLDEHTNIHWHGLIVPENMDGHPQYLVQSNSAFKYQFTINQKANISWFHPHPHLITGRQVNKGLAGMVIVSDNEEKSLNLPSNELDLPIIIQDKRLYADGGINYSPTNMEIMSGYFGQYVCVNGLWSVYHNIKTKIYRLRILNASNARVYNLEFSNNLNFNIIGSDGGLLKNTQIVNKVLLSPGERIDVLVDFSQLTVGSEFFLQSNTFNGGESQGKESFKIMKFIVNEKVTENFTIPNTLATYTSIPAALSTKTRTFDISNKHVMAGSEENGGMNMAKAGVVHNIDGKSFEMDRIDETVSAGSTEIWEFNNSEGTDIHPMHLHGVFFQVLSRTGGRGAIQPHETGWKDTVLCLPEEKVKIIMTFPNNLGKFVFHCHNLEHGDSGMMLNFKIV